MYGNFVHTLQLRCTAHAQGCILQWLSTDTIQQQHPVTLSPCQQHHTIQQQDTLSLLKYSKHTSHTINVQNTVPSSLCFWRHNARQMLTEWRFKMPLNNSTFLVYFILYKYKSITQLICSPYMQLLTTLQNIMHAKNNYISVFITNVVS